MKDRITLKEVVVQNFFDNKKYYILLWVILGIGAFFCAIQTYRLCNSGIDFDKVYEQESSWLMSETVSSDIMYGHISTAQLIDYTKKAFHPMKVYNGMTVVLFYIAAILGIVLYLYILSRHTKNVSVTVRKRLFVISLLCHSVVLFGIICWFDSMTISCVDNYLVKGGGMLITTILLLILLFLICVFFLFWMYFKTIFFKKGKGDYPRNIYNLSHH